MALTRYSTSRPSLSPWDELDELTDRLNRVFGTTRRSNGGTWAPAVNVEETADELRLTAEMPGMSHEDIEIELENNILSISGEKQETREKQDEESRYHLWERRFGTFQRSFTLPRTVNAEEIEARFQDGILHVHMPKVPEAKGRKIEIRAEG